MSQFPYYTEPTHDAGSTTTAGRDTATSVLEGRMIVDVVDRIFLLEPNKHFRKMVPISSNANK